MERSSWGAIMKIIRKKLYRVIREDMAQIFDELCMIHCYASKIKKRLEEEDTHVIKYNKTDIDHCDSILKHEHMARELLLDMIVRVCLK